MPYGSSRTIGIQVSRHGVSSILIVILDYTINRLVLARYLTVHVHVELIVAHHNGNSNCCTALTAELKKWDKRLVKWDSGT